MAHHVSQVSKLIRFVYESTGEAVTYDMPWEAGQPDNLGAEDCRHYFNLSNRKGFNDIRCNHNGFEMKFICETELI